MAQSLIWPETGEIIQKVSGTCIDYLERAIEETA